MDIKKILREIATSWDNRLQISSKPIEVDDDMGVRSVEFHLVDEYHNLYLTDQGAVMAQILGGKAGPRAVPQGEVYNLYLKAPIRLDHNHHSARMFLKDLIAHINDIKFDPGLEQDNELLEIISSIESVEQLRNAARFFAVKADLPDGIDGDQKRASIVDEFEKKFAYSCPEIVYKSVANFISSCAKKYGVDVMKSIPSFRMVNAEYFRYAKTFRDLINGYDQEVINILHMNGQQGDKQAYRWFTIGDEKGWRRQALRTYPFFAGEIAKLAFLRSAIDNGDAVGPKIQASVGNMLSMGIIKRLNGNEFDAHGISLSYYFHHIGKIKPDWIPQEKAKVQALIDVLAILKPVLDTIKSDINVLCKDSKGNWDEYKKKMAALPLEYRMAQGITRDDWDFVKGKVALIEELNALHGPKISSALAESLVDEMLKTLNTEARLEEIDRNQLLEMVLFPIKASHADHVSMSAWVAELVSTVELFKDQVVLPISSISTKYAERNITQEVIHEAERIAVETLAANKAIQSIADFYKKYRTVTYPRLEVLRDQVNQNDSQKGETDLVDSQSIMSKTDEELMQYNLNSLDPYAAAMKESDLGRRFNLDVPYRIDQWVPCLKTFFKTSNDYYFVPLWNDRQKSYEGWHGTDRFGVTGLMLCVGGQHYSQLAKKGMSFLVSCRKLTPNGYERVAMLEMTCAANDTDLHYYYGQDRNEFILNTLKRLRDKDRLVKVTTRQFYTTQNQTPNASALAAKDEFVAALNENPDLLNLDNLIHRIEISNRQKEIKSRKSVVKSRYHEAPPQYLVMNQKTPIELMSDLAGFDVTSSENLQIALDAWSPCLPKSWRSKVDHTDQIVDAESAKKADLPSKAQPLEVIKTNPDIARLTKIISPENKAIETVVSFLPNLIG